MTGKQAREQLPQIKAKWNGHTWDARTSGRLNAQASVAICGRWEGKRYTPILGPIFHAAWDTVARLADSGRPLICD